MLALLEALMLYCAEHDDIHLLKIRTGRQNFAELGRYFQHTTTIENCNREYYETRNTSQVRMVAGRSLICIIRDLNLLRDRHRILGSFFQKEMRARDKARIRSCHHIQCGQKLWRGNIFQYMQT